MRRYARTKPSRGTVISSGVRGAVLIRDGFRCVGGELGWESHTSDCIGLELDHVRGSGAMGKKSPSEPWNLVTLGNACHLWKTLNGRTARPLLLAYLERFYPAASPAASEGMDGATARR